MSKKITIAIDAMGGENAPAKNIAGLDIFIKRNKDKKDFYFYIFGDQDRINIELDKNKTNRENIKIFHTTSVVSDEESPLKAIKSSKNSSMWNAVNSQLNMNSDITLSAGNTGVLFVISKMILKNIDKISRPALAALWPNKKGSNVVLDLGANVECDENNLVEFAEMGAALYKSLFVNEVPKVALLNIGSEEIKGTDTIKKAYNILSEISQRSDFQFNGYIEGNKIPDGDSNVIITDGFTGNIALKTAEGTAKFLTDTLKNVVSENIISKILISLSYFSLKKFKNKLDPRKFNGAIFLGLSGPVVKSHGATDKLGFYYAIDLCYKIVKGNLMKEIKNNLSHLNEK